MADPPIRAGRDQRVLRPRYDSVGEIGAETAEYPDQQQGGTHANTDAGPTEPERKPNLRPAHPGRVNNVGQQPEHPRQTDGPQSDEDEDAFLSSIESFAACLRFQSVVDADWTYGDQSQDQDESEDLLVVHHGTRRSQIVLQ